MKTITQHMQLSKQQRQAHIDLTSPCIPAVYTRNTVNNKKGVFSDKRHGSVQSKKKLIEYHQIENFKGRNVHTCHKCLNDSTSPNGFVCLNPLHLYFGSPKENSFDISCSDRKQRSKKGGLKGGNTNSKKGKKYFGDMGKKGVAKALKNGNHISHKEATCPHCGKTGKYAPMMQWHFDRCKHKV
jgi:ribosomal protein L37AE/L43A